MVGSYRHLISISQSKSDQLAYIIHRTKRMIIILGLSAFSILLAGICFILSSFLYPEINADTLGPSDELTAFASQFFAAYVIGIGFSFDELIYNQLHSNTSAVPSKTKKFTSSFMRGNIVQNDNSSASAATSTAGNVRSKSVMSSAHKEGSLKVHRGN